MRVLVIGGTGFIGYHVVRALRAQGDEVVVLCRHPAAVEELFLGDAAAIAGDVNTLTTEDYLPLLEGIDAVVFAAGVDERAQVQGEPLAFFYAANVWPCEQLFTAVARSGVQRAVLLGSIFAWLHARQPELQLAQRHPYIRSRVEQDSVAHAALAGTSKVLVTLQVPWVFGHAPHRESQWTALVSFVRAAAPLMCIRGGANMLSVQALAAAVSGAVRFPLASQSLPVGDENLSYAELMQRLCPIVRRKDRRVHPVTDGFFRDVTALGHFFGELFGKQGGIELNGMADLLCQEIFFDPAPAQALLHYQGGDLDAALSDMVAAMPESALMASWRRTVNWFSPR